MTLGTVAFCGPTFSRLAMSRMVLRRMSRRMTLAWVRFSVSGLRLVPLFQI